MSNTKAKSSKKNDGLRKSLRSILQKETSRRNGAKSRGPVTPQGKEASKMNALKHGAYAKANTTKGLSQHEKELYEECEEAVRSEYGCGCKSIEFHIASLASANANSLKVGNMQSRLLSFEAEAIWRAETVDVLQERSDMAADAIA